MAALKNAQHEKFCQELLKGNTIGGAYLSAGYKAKNPSVASAAGNRLLKNVKISARLEELRSKAADKAVLDRAWVIDRLMRNARIALGEETVLVKKGEDETEVTLRDAAAANKALELLGKLPELALFIERTEVGRPGEFDRMSDAELERIARSGSSSGIAASANGAAKPDRLH